MKKVIRGIAGIRLENIGKFEAFELCLDDGQIIELQGDNDFGKSTVLQVVEAAIFGNLEEKTGPNHAAPDGEGTMTVEVNGYTITRMVQTTEKGPKTKSLEVVDHLGNRPYKGSAVQTFLDSVFPKGIPVGEIAGVRSEPSGLFKSADIRPRADLNRLEEVLILTRVFPETGSPPGRG